MLCLSFFGCKKATDNTSCPNWAIYIPNSFSPNGDGINDVFRPVIGDGIDGTNVGSPFNCYMWIFDNQGKQLFYSNIPWNEGWNGEVNNSGTTCPQGIYTYKITTSDSCGINHIYTGTFSLLK